MKPTLMLLALVLTLGVAEASDVFMTKDAQGHPIYTDRPEQLPAERLNVKSNTTDTVEVQKRYEAEMKQLESTGAANDDTQKQSSVAQARRSRGPCEALPGSARSLSQAPELATAL
jgi:hypothetical protein